MSFKTDLRQILDSYWVTFPSDTTLSDGSISTKFDVMDDEVIEKITALFLSLPSLKDEKDNGTVAQKANFVRNQLRKQVRKDIQGNNE